MNDRYLIIKGERDSGKIAWLEFKIKILKQRLKEANHLICELCEKCGEDVCKHGEECDWKESEVTNNA